MSEIGKVVGELAVNNLTLTIIIILYLVHVILKHLFKVRQKEVDPLGKVVGWVGKKLTKDVQSDVAVIKTDVTTLKTDVTNLKTYTEGQFKKVETDRIAKINELKKDYNSKITELKTDIDGFETRTVGKVDEMICGTRDNCEALKKRLDEMDEATQKSNDMQTIRQIRAHVLDFANSCMNKRKHTKLEFENIIEENTQYEELCKKYVVKNNVYKEDYEFIMKIYHKCQDEGSFLNENVNAGSEVNT